ncbi:MAG TPA: DUF6282 family protein [Terriglobales bacterium]|nr:DUF6282 family protein [Terriglobales bacterium]
MLVSRVLFTRRLQVLCFLLLAAPAFGQQDLSLNGSIDFRVHSAPDSIERSMDADDLARLAKQRGMRALVFKNHTESTAALAYLVRKQVPGLEVFGGIALNEAVGGVNLEAVRRLSMMKGGTGKVVWMPTVDSVNMVTKLKEKRTTIPVSKNGKLLPEVIAVIDFIAKHPDMVLETGDSTAEEALMIIHEARQRGVAHVIATNPRGMFVDMTIPQMKQAASEGAYLEFIYRAVIGEHPQRTLQEYANAIRQAGPEHCLLGSDFGPGGKDADHWLSPDGIMDFMKALRKEGFSVDEINMMAKTNPARALGLKP